MLDRFGAAVSFALTILMGPNAPWAYAQPCTPTWDTAIGQPGIDGSVQALAVFDDGSGAALYAGGLFVEAGGVGANNTAKWDGSSWSSVDSGTSNVVWALSAVQEASAVGPALYAGGSFDQAGVVPADKIAAWDGTAWTSLGSGMNSDVIALEVFDDSTGLALYAGGLFAFAGGSRANRIAKWDGSTWQPLEVGAINGLNNVVSALAVFDDGSGPALYAGGNFTAAGGTSGADRIAKWDGVAWSALSTGTDLTVLALAVFDDGSGPGLYAGGKFTRAGGANASRIARWDGAGWSPLGDGMNDTVSALAVFDDGTGPALYAGGEFTTAGGVDANHIARWDGNSWSPLGDGTNGDVLALAGCEETPALGTGLYVGGSFSRAGGESASRIARWLGCPPPIPGDCDGDGDVGLSDHETFVDCFTGPMPITGGDYDGDGDVDLSDFAFWRPCLAGPGVTPGGGCEEMDFDADNDVDLSDYAAYLMLFTGSEGPVPPECECADLDEDADVDLLDWQGYQAAFASGL